MKKLLHKVCIIIAALALSGCLTTGNGGIVQGIVDTSRGALTRAEAYKCEIAPLGSVNWYYNTPELMAAKEAICRRNAELKQE